MQSELTGVLSILVGGLVSVVVAWISRPRPRKDESEEEEPRQDLTTIAGIAAVVAEQGVRISELEAAREHDGRVIAALRRYVLALKTAMRTAGVEPPEPAPDDVPLIGR
ncbi:hypothetical protein [Streptomyces sp. NPDC057325]|uniref:hypothetical protein n=1 Tax=unclassified Streptomyces TaxID=2593676 RepID=UPI00362FE398